MSVIVIGITVSACAAPDINDWPPDAPAVSEAVIQHYVDIYAADEPEVPVYSADDIMALNIITRRELRSGQADEDIERFRAELNARQVRESIETPQKKARSKAQINAIKRRIARKYDSHHEQRHILKSKYGL